MTSMLRRPPTAASEDTEDSTGIAAATMAPAATAAPKVRRRLNVCTLAERVGSARQCFMRSIRVAPIGLGVAGARDEPRASGRPQTTSPPTVNSALK